MKKYSLIAMIMCVVVGLTACTRTDDKPLKFNQLPQKSQKFVQTYFKNVSVSYAKMEKEITTTYEVMLVNGAKIEFDANGSWMEVECKGTVVPKGIIPTKITQYVAQKYKQETIVKIEKERGGFEVMLRNGVELHFDKQENFIRVDR